MVKVTVIRVIGFGLLGLESGLDVRDRDYRYR